MTINFIQLEISFVFNRSIFVMIQN